MTEPHSDENDLRPRPNFIHWLHTLLWKICGRLPDLYSLSEISDQCIVHLVRNWNKNPSPITELGIVEPLKIDVVLGLLPEVLAELLLSRPGAVGVPKVIEVVLRAGRGPEVRAPLHALPIYAAAKRALETGLLPDGEVEEIMYQSSTANVTLIALERGTSAVGGKLTIRVHPLTLDAMADSRRKDGR